MSKPNTALSSETLFLFSTSGSQSSIEKHNKALQGLSSKLSYFSFAHKISGEEYAKLLKSPISRGGAVTGQGLKSSIIPFLDEVEKLAEETNAVNTVVNHNGRLHGYNTDAFGFEEAIKQHVTKTGISLSTAIIYGNGGVSGVAAYVLRKMGVKTTMAGRNENRVTSKMTELGLTKFAGPYDLVVNATPLSSFPLEKAESFLDILKGCKMVFDHNMPEKDNKVNYLEDYCVANDIHFITGYDMYVPQMIKQWMLFLNVEDQSNGHGLVSEEEIIDCWHLAL